MLLYTLLYITYYAEVVHLRLGHART